MPAVRGRGAASNPERAGRFNSRPIRRLRNWPGHWRHPSYCNPPSLAANGKPGASRRVEKGGPARFAVPLWQTCPAETAGLLSRLLRPAPAFPALLRGPARARSQRDRFCCQGCGVRSRLVVHHRTEANEDEALITLCIRCHVRVHRWRCLHHWMPGVLLKLWSELHADVPVQLQFQFAPVVRFSHDCSARLWAEATQGQDRRARRVSTVYQGTMFCSQSRMAGSHASLGAMP
jgi:hypothetical protein